MGGLSERIFGHALRLVFLSALTYVLGHLDNNLGYNTFWATPRFSRGMMGGRGIRKVVGTSRQGMVGGAKRVGTREGEGMAEGGPTMIIELAHVN